MIIDRCRDIEEFKRVHAECENDRLPSAEDILRNWDYHFCFYKKETEELTGCIYLEDEDGKVCLSGFSRRKNYDIVIRAIKYISELVREDDLYSMTDKPSAKIVLRRCGFKQIDKETFLRKAF
jgi:hypothetical protein